MADAQDQCPGARTSGVVMGRDVCVYVGVHVVATLKKTKGNRDVDLTYLSLFLPSFPCPGG